MQSLGYYIHVHYYGDKFHKNFLQNFKNIYCFSYLDHIILYQDF